MIGFDWKLAEQRLSSLLEGIDDADRYYVINMVARLRTRFMNGERSLRLHNEIMTARQRYAKTMASEQQRKSAQ
ncbi:MAG TPA: hypothetical protein VGR15_06065 [Bacteroidota bacterium]|jgi:hypothetical protein|nr:hypothetical protein [Bacteroidota bacterium]